MLPEHGEEKLAERVLTVTDAELERIGELGGYYAWSEDAFELLGASPARTGSLRWGLPGSCQTSNSPKSTASDSAPQPRGGLFQMPDLGVPVTV